MTAIEELEAAHQNLRRAADKVFNALEAWDTTDRVVYLCMRATAGRIEADTHELEALILAAKHHAVK